MLKKIVLCTSEKGPAITLGKIAEFALFYQNVHLVLNYGNFKSLVKSAGAASFLSFLGRDNVSATYFMDTLGTITIDSGPIKTHDFIAFSYAGSEKKGKISGFRNIIEDSLKEIGYTGKEAKDYSKQFVQLVSKESWQSESFIQDGVLKLTRNILNDSDYISKAIQIGLTNKTNEEIFPLNFSFNILKAENGFKILSNINFAEVNQKNKILDPTGGNITEALLINNILTAQAEMLLASHHQAELFTSNLTSSLIKVRYKSLIDKINHEQAQLQSFLEVTSKSRSISEAIDSGEKTFDDFLNLLDEAQKIREWIKGAQNDENILRKYLEEISNKGWAENLPVKLLRYFTTVTLGISNPVIGGVVSALDTFLVDKIGTGWRPNHFVEGPMHNFLE